MSDEPFVTIDEAIKRGNLIARWVRERKLEESARHRVCGPATFTTLKVREYTVRNRAGNVVLHKRVQDEGSLPSEQLIAELSLAMIGAGYGI